MKTPKGAQNDRTVAEGQTKNSIKADNAYLLNVWEYVSRKKEEGGKAQTKIY